MTTADDVVGTSPAEALTSAEQTRCTVCAHELDRHDPIGLRFCRATQTQALSRGCICR